MKRNRNRRLTRTLRVEPHKPGTRPTRPLSRAVARATPDVQRYSYQIALRGLALKMRSLSKRLRRVETQVARGYITFSGTKAEMEDSDKTGNGMLWWAIDENVLYVYDYTGWQLSKATRAGTTNERQLYVPIFTGEMWWDTTLELLFIWNGDAWDDIAVAHSGTTLERGAYSQDRGDAWWDTTEKEWYGDIGNGWQVMSPNIQDAFSRAPSLLLLFKGGTERIGIIPYNTWRGVGGGIHSQHGSALALYAWVRPQNTVNSNPAISEWCNDISDNEIYFYSLEQNDDVFSFGLSDDGVRATRAYIATDTISNITNGWHFVVGIYRPGVFMKIFHNGVWKRAYHGFYMDVPYSRYFDDDLYHSLEINYKRVVPHHVSNIDWAFCGIGVTVPTEGLVEYIYDRTKGFFL